MKLYISKEFNQKFPEVNCAVMEVVGVKVNKDTVLTAEDYKHKDKFKIYFYGIRIKYFN